MPKLNSAKIPDGKSAKRTRAIIFCVDKGEWSCGDDETTKRLSILFSPNYFFCDFLFALTLALPSRKDCVNRLNAGQT